MIRVFLLAFNVFLIVLFSAVAIRAVEIKEKKVGVLMGVTSVIIALNSVFILNS